MQTWAIFSQYKLKNPANPVTSWKSWGRSSRLGKICASLGPSSPGYLRPLYPANSGNLRWAWTRIIELKTNLITKNFLLFDAFIKGKIPTEILDAKRE